LFPTICSAVNSVNIRDSTIKKNRKRGEKNARFIFHLSTIEGCSPFFSATKWSVRLPWSYHFTTIEMPLLTNSWKNHALYEKCVRYSRKLVFFNWESSSFIRSPWRCCSGSFCKFREAFSYTRLLFPIPSATSLEIALFPKACALSVSFYRAKRSKVANKGKRSIFLFTLTREADGKDLPFEQHDKSQDRRVTQSFIDFTIFIADCIIDVRSTRINGRKRNVRWTSEFYRLTAYQSHLHLRVTSRSLDCTSYRNTSMRDFLRGCDSPRKREVPRGTVCFPAICRTVNSERVACMARALLQDGNGSWPNAEGGRRTSTESRESKLNSGEWWCGGELFWRRDI